MNRNIASLPHNILSPTDKQQELRELVDECCGALESQAVLETWFFKGSHPYKAAIADRTARDAGGDQRTVLQAIAYAIPQLCKVQPPDSTIPDDMHDAALVAVKASSGSFVF